MITFYTGDHSVNDGGGYDDGLAHGDDDGDDHDHDAGDGYDDDDGEDDDDDVKKISGEEVWNKHSSSNISARSYIALTL